MVIKTDDAIRKLRFPYSIIGLSLITTSCTHYYTNLLHLKYFREGMTGHSTSVLVAAVALASNLLVSPQEGAQHPPYFSAHVYCGQTVAHLSYC